jgi:hypothetical protein
VAQTDKKSGGITAGPAETLRRLVERVFTAAGVAAADAATVRGTSPTPG